jgi:hypothetical protein
MYGCFLQAPLSSQVSFFFQASPTGMLEGHTYLLNDNFVFVFVDGFVAVVVMYPEKIAEIFRLESVMETNEELD